GKVISQICRCIKEEGVPGFQLRICLVTVLFIHNDASPIQNSYYSSSR
ncbi:hypothetical protein JTE90_015961, partial [Oedothorax gibbosus]